MVYTLSDGVVNIDRPEGITLQNCANVVAYISKATHVKVIGGKRVTIVLKDAVDPTPETPYLEAWDSPLLTIKDSDITGGGIYAESSPGIKVEGSVIDLQKSLAEGIDLRGCDGFVIRGNTITGVMERGYNDLVQIYPGPQKERTRHPYRWPDRTAFLFDPWEPPSDWQNPYVKRATFLAGEHAGKTITYGHDDYNWTRGGLITQNTLKNSSVAAVFILRGDGIQVNANRVINSRDYHLGAEWSKNCEIRDNLCIQEPEFIGVGTGGGIFSMYYGENHVIEGNTVRGSRIAVQSNGAPQTNITIQNNEASSIWSWFGDATWVDGLYILGNKVSSKIEIAPSPFYTRGAIVGNYVEGSSSHAFGISVTAFEGPITNNTIIQPNRGGTQAFRDYNVGAERMTSKAVVSGNTVNGKPAELEVWEKGKAPVTSSSASAGSVSASARR